MNPLIPATVAQMIAAAREKEEQEKARRLQEVEKERLDQEREIAEAFVAFLGPLLPLIPEALRAYVCLPQRFEHVPDDYHFQVWKRKHLAFDIPGLAPIVDEPPED